MDADKTGLISVEELRQAMAASPDIHMSNEQIDMIIQEVDYFQTKKINYSEFLMATLDVKIFLDDNKLNAIFN